MLRQLLVVSAVVLISFGTVGWVAAQSGSRDDAPPPDRNRTGTNGVQSNQGSGQRAAPSFEEQLWTYLQQTQYRNWAPLPGQTDEAYEGHGPHGDKVKLYVNRPAAGRSVELPNGAVLVKENYDATGTKLMAITVMYRSKGFAPDSGDWHWTKYEPNGEVSTMNGMRVAGRVNMCIECHKSAGGGDYVFANDR